MNANQRSKRSDVSRSGSLTPSHPTGRFRPRPIVATATVMALAVLTVFTVLNVLTVPADNSSVSLDHTSSWSTVWAGVRSLADPQWLPPLLARAGWLAPVVFVAAFVPVTLLGVPRTVLTVTAGWVFGAWTGALLAWGAGLLAACVGYELARAVTASRGRDGGNLGAAGPLDGMRSGWRAGGQRLVEQAQRVDRACSARSGLFGVVSARLVPVLPFALVNYGCGALRVPRRLFVLGSGIGLLPGACA